MSIAETHLTRFLPGVVLWSKTIGYYIDYYIFNPSTQKMDRKRVKVQRICKRYRTKRERMLAAQGVCDQLNRKLSGGWSPLHETEDTRLYTPIAELQKKFLAAKKKEGCRPTTLVNYTSFTNIFLRWCEDTGRAKKYSGTFLRIDAVAYMDDIMEKPNGNRSYNNTLKALRCFFEWAKDHCYCKENPFEGMKVLPKEKKKRILVDPQSRSMIADYFRRNKPQMEVVVKLVYYSAMRPLEVSKVQMRHIDIKRRCILIPEENAKNGKSRCATLTQDLIDLIAPMADGDHPDWYLFGSGRSIAPGPKRVTRNYFCKCWDKMRVELALPEEMQLYSLRDTGLTDMIHAGIDQLTVQHHADHSSLAMQNIYTDHFDPTLNETIYNKAPKF